MAGIVETTYAKSLFEVAAELDKLEVRFKTVLQPADIRTASLR